jgi:hypothetical protein
MHATSIKPVGVGLVLSSALICAGFCVRVKKEKTTQNEVSRVVVITRRRRRRRARIRKKGTYNQQNERTGVASDGDDIFLGPIARTRHHSRVILIRVRAFGCRKRIRLRLSFFLAFFFPRRSRRRSGRHVCRLCSGGEREKSTRLTRKKSKCRTAFFFMTKNDTFFISPASTKTHKK